MFFSPRKKTDKESAIDRLEQENEILRKRVQDLRAVGEIARSISSTLLIEEILRGILQGIQSVLDMKRVVLGLVNSSQKCEEMKLHIGIDVDLSQCVWSMDDDIWVQLSQSKKPIIINVDSNPNLPPFLRRTFDRDFIKAPMIVKRQIVGSVMAEYLSHDATGRDLELLEMLVQYAGIAIENGRLYYDVIRSGEELQKTQTLLVERERLAAIGELAVSINHEINNPLCNISLITQILRRELKKEAPGLVDRLEGIDESIKRIQDVTHRVAELKRADATQYVDEQRMIDLGQ